MRSKVNSDSAEIDERQELLKMNSLEDMSWLCSLSESELDMLIGLKMLAIQHARMIGHEELAQKFDLKMLRALALILMEDNKEKAKALVPDLHESASFMDSSNLLKVDEHILMEEEEIRECTAADSRKRR